MKGVSWLPLFFLIILLFLIIPVVGHGKAQIAVGEFIAQFCLDVI
jgi:hypothetical protein